MGANEGDRERPCSRRGVGGKLIKDGFANRQDIETYVHHHYLVLPVVDKQRRPWVLDGEPV